MFQCEHPLLQQLFPEGKYDGFYPVNTFLDIVHCHTNTHTHTLCMMYIKKSCPVVVFLKAALNSDWSNLFLEWQKLINTLSSWESMLLSLHICIFYPSGNPQTPSRKRPSTAATKFKVSVHFRESESGNKNTVWYCFVDTGLMKDSCYPYRTWI